LLNKVSNKVKFHEFMHCGYEKVPVLHGAVIEGIATCMCQLTGRVMSQLNPKYGNPITAFVGTALVVAGNAEFNDYGNNKPFKG
jgi:hypothetical protein